jgi:hypothetical protein
MVVRDIYTEAGFESMGWHSCSIHAMAFESRRDGTDRLLLDIDYLVEWLQPDPDSETPCYLISPATLVFGDARDLEISDIKLSGWGFRLLIRSARRDGPDEHGMSTWKLAGHLFELSVRSRGFTQYLRREPVFSRIHWLPVEERGGLSFAEQGFGDTPA